MNTQEFKAWFSGYSEHIEKSPSESEWERIKEEIRKMTAVTSPTAHGIGLLGGLPRNYGGVSPLREPVLTATNCGTEVVLP